MTLMKLFPFLVILHMSSHRSEIVSLACYTRETQAKCFSPSILLNPLHSNHSPLLVSLFTPLFFQLFSKLPSTTPDLPPWQVKTRIIDSSDMPANSGKKNHAQAIPKMIMFERARNIEGTALELPYWLTKWKLCD